MSVTIVSSEGGSFIHSLNKQCFKVNSVPDIVPDARNRTELDKFFDLEKPESSRADKCTVEKLQSQSVTIEVKQLENYEVQRTK